jgi:hypothetical protein
MASRSGCLFDGIDQEARRLLESKNVSRTMLDVLSRMNPVRQAEAARLMVAANCYDAPYAKALIGATDRTLIRCAKARPRVRMTPRKSKAVNEEITKLAEKLKKSSSITGSDLLTLLVARRYAESLLENRRIRKYLEKQWPAACKSLTDLTNSNGAF